MDHFVKISSFRYVLPACWLSCSLLVSVFFFPSLCFLFVDDCWLVIAFSNRYRYLLSLWIVLQLFHSYADFRWDRGNFSWRCFVLNELWPFCCVCCCLIRMFIDPCFKCMCSCFCTQELKCTDVTQFYTYFHFKENCLVVNLDFSHYVFFFSFILFYSSTLFTYMYNNSHV